LRCRLSIGLCLGETRMHRRPKRGKGRGRKKENPLRLPYRRGEILQKKGGRKRSEGEKKEKKMEGRAPLSSFLFTVIDCQKREGRGKGRACSSRKEKGGKGEGETCVPHIVLTALFQRGPRPRPARREWGKREKKKRPLEGGGKRNKTAVSTDSYLSVASLCTGREVEPKKGGR